MPLHRIKLDIYNRHIDEVRKLWRDEDSMRMNPIILETGIGNIEIQPLCYKRQGCQGAIIVRDFKGKEVLTANMKRGTIIWYLGDKIKENDIFQYIKWVNYVIKIMKIIKPIVNILPTEYYMKTEWDVEITLITSSYRLPEFCKNKETKTLTLTL